MKSVVKEILKFILLKSNDLNKLESRLNNINYFAVLLGDKIRKLNGENQSIPEIESFDKQKKLTISICKKDAPWSNIFVKENNIPGMLSLEEKKYYQYIGQFYQGKGNIVELGPWLGSSTIHIIQGLVTNPNYLSRKLYVYDDFVWRSSWMDKWVVNETMLPFKPNNHEDFYPLFDHFTTQMKDHIAANKRKIDDYDGNEKITKLEWDKGPIEILYVDCGRTFSVNQAWFNIFSHAFISGATLLIMQDWRTHREVPLKWYNQIKQFTDSKGSQLTLIHELGGGGIATFLYR